MTSRLDHRRDWLIDHLASLAPSSILDVACGEGWLLHWARDRSIAAKGVDEREDRVAPLAAAGFDVVAASANALPVASASADVVVLRHCLHHMNDVGGALAEAARACRRAMLVAEPWFDVSIPSQAFAKRVDDWVKRLERRLGHVHHPYLNANDVLSRLPDRRAFDVEVTYRLSLAPKPRDAWFAEVEDALATVGPADPLRPELDAIEEELRTNETTADGAMILTLKRCRAGTSLGA